MEPHAHLDRYYADDRERRQLLDRLFDASAAHYDRIDRILSFGSGPFYRRRCLRRAGLRPGMRVLDVATGTGLLARAAAELTGNAAAVVGLDPSRGMLRQAQAQELPRLVRGIGDSLPFADATFDMVTMGYGLRHVADLEHTFAEYRRVLRPGGKVLLLELTKPRGRIGTFVAKTFLDRLVPRLTRLRTGSAPAEELMRYFWATIEHCVPPAAIMAAMAAVGLTAVRRGVSMGICSDYSAVAPAAGAHGS